MSEFFAGIGRGTIKFLSKNRIFIVTFFVAFSIMLAAFGVNQMYPVGDRQILVIDAWHQYYPFLSEFHNKIQSGGSLLYNHNIGLGVNFWLLSAYYTNSPLNWLSILVPSQYITEFMMVATAAKIAFAAMFMAMLLHWLYRRKDSFLLVFGLLYAFSTYFMGYYWCIMWLDSIMLLPLIILGLHKIIRGGREFLYIFSLAIAIISNYYIGYMICIFVAIYYVYLSLVYYKPKNALSLCSQTLRVVFFSLIGVALSAFVLIPTYHGMQLASSAKFTFPTKLVFDRDFVTVLNRMLPAVKPAVVEGLPNIASGTLSLYMLYLYFRNRRIRLSEKIGSFVFIMFLLLGFSTNILNFVWHGLHYPNGIPFRFAFVFVFFVVTTAYRAFVCFDGVRVSEILGFTAAMLLYLLYSSGGAVDTYVAIIAMVPVITCGVILAKLAGYVSPERLPAQPGKLRRGAAFALVAFVVIESFAGAIYGVAVTGSSSRSKYRLYGDDVAAALAEMRRVDSGIYRTEMARIYTTNDSSVYGYRGASVFSSTLNSRVTVFLRKLGAMGDGPSNRYSLPMSTPIFDSLFNIKYFIGRNELGTAEFTGYTDLGRWNDVRLLRNDYALPLGFFAPNSVLAVDSTSNNPFNVQQNLYMKLAGERFDFYKKVTPSIVCENATGTYDGSLRYSYSLTNSDKEGRAVISYVFEEDGDYYVYVFAPKVQNGSYHIMQSPGAEERVENYEVRRGIVVPTGRVKAGGNIEIELKLEKGFANHIDYAIVKGNHREFERAFERINMYPFEVTRFEDTLIEGKITAPENGYALITIPYENGWSAEVNGQRAVISGFKDAFILVPVRMGDNTISLSYFPEGLREGLMLSGFALLAVVILALGYVISAKIGADSRGKKAPLGKKTQFSESAFLAAVASDVSAINSENPPKSVGSTEIGVIAEKTASVSENAVLEPVASVDKSLDKSLDKSPDISSGISLDDGSGAAKADVKAVSYDPEDWVL